MNDSIALAFRNPLGYEAGRLLEHYDRTVAGLTEAQRSTIEAIGDELAVQLRAYDEDGILTALRMMTVNPQVSDLHGQLVAAGIPATPKFVASVCFVNWPLPLQAVVDRCRDPKPISRNLTTAGPQNLNDPEDQSR